MGHCGVICHPVMVADEECERTLMGWSHYPNLMLSILIMLTLLNITFVKSSGGEVLINSRSSLGFFELTTLFFKNNSSLLENTQ